MKAGRFFSFFKNRLITESVGKKTVHTWMILVLGLSFLPVQQIFCQSFLQQKINFEINNSTVADALLDLSELADVSIAFNSYLFDGQQKISLSARNQTLKYCLDYCLRNTNVDYKIKNKRIVLFRKQAEYFIINGYIEDANSGERLISATVWDVYSGLGTVTNEYGFFSLQLPRDKVDLQFSYLGYEPQNRVVDLQRNTRLKVGLKPSVTLIEIIVSNKDTNRATKEILLGEGLVVNADDIRQNPALGGEHDVIRHLQTKAGVLSGADGLGGLFVRGGSSDQNLILFDGVPVFNPSHTLGLFSVFNTSMIRSASFSKDGFSAKYGGRLSSVLDIRSKEGNTKQLVLEAETTTLSTKAMVEVPLVLNKSAILISARRSHIDPWVKSYSSNQKNYNEETGESAYYFYDFNAKFHTALSKNDRLFLSFYKGKDDFEDRTNWSDTLIDELGVFTISNQSLQRLKWGNTISALRWNHIFGKRLFANTTLTFSQYDYDSENEWQYLEVFQSDTLRDDYYTSFRSRIQDAALKIDFDYFFNHRHKFIFGFGALLRSFEPGAIEVDDYLSENNLDENLELWSDSPSFKAKELDVYVEDRILLSKQVNLLLGIHAASFLTDEEAYFSIQPRLNIEWKPVSTLRTYFTVSKMTQFLHVLTSSSAGLPTDLWVPSTALIKPEHSWQTSFTVLADSKKGYTTKISAYYKKMNGLLHYLNEVNLPTLYENDPLFWEEEVTVGEGVNYGIEAQLQKTKGKTKATIAYAYTRSFRTFDELNNGFEFPFAFDKPHQINIQFVQQISKNTSLQLAWQMSSGQGITLIETDSPLALLNNLGADYEQISDINAHYLAPYHRLDLNVQFKFGKKQYQHFLNLGLNNVYNQANTYYEYRYENENFPEDSGIVQQYSLGILPAIGYRLRFEKN